MICFVGFMWSSITVDANTSADGCTHNHSQVLTLVTLLMFVSARNMSITYDCTPHRSRFSVVAGNPGDNVSCNDWDPKSA